MIKQLKNLTAGLIVCEEADIASRLISIKHVCDTFKPNKNNTISFSVFIDVGGILADDFDINDTATIPFVLNIRNLANNRFLKLTECNIPISQDNIVYSTKTYFHETIVHRVNNLELPFDGNYVLELLYPDVSSQSNEPILQIEKNIYISENIK